MCGLTGIAGNLEAQNDPKIFRQLLLLSSLRGEDSTGIASGSFADPDPVVFKMCVPSYDFVGFVKAVSLINKGDRLLLGHCRYRTVGEIIKDNAQPFEFEGLIGTHNGTLDWGSKNRLEGPANFKTDSQSLYYRIDKDGLQAAVGMTNAKDALALVWYDKANDTLNMYKNKERPLFYVYSQDRKRIFWASEAGMLYLVLNREGVPFDKVKTVGEGRHLSWKMPEKGQPFGKVTIQQIEQPKAVVYIKRNHFQSQWDGDDDEGQQHFSAVNDWRSRSSVSAAASAAVFTNTENKGEKLSANIIDTAKFRPDRMISRRPVSGGSYYKNYDGNELGQDKFNESVAAGCCVCGCIPAWGEPVKFLRDGNILCHFCLNEAVSQYKLGDGDKSPCNILINFA